MFLIFIRYHSKVLTPILKDGFDSKIIPSKLKIIWILMDDYVEIVLRF